MKMLNSLSRWMGYVSAVTIGLLMLLVVTDICGRGLSTWFEWAKPITGASELASLLMIIVVFPSLAWAALSVGHVKVDLLVARFSPRKQAIIDSFTLLATLVTYIFITWRSVLEALETNNVTSLIRLPHAPFYWIMTAGWAVFCLSIAALLATNIIKAVKR